MIRQADKPAAQKILQGILEAQKVSTMRSIFERIEPGEDGRIRTSMNPAGTETGRLSHSQTFLEKSTNLANLPKFTAKLDELYQVRSCIQPTEGRLLVSADYSKSEARFAAYMAGDERAIREYEEGVPRYIEFAERLFGVDIEDKSDSRYSVGKAGVLQRQYKGTWRTVKTNVEKRSEVTGATVTTDEAKEAVRLFDELYPGYKRWWQQIEEKLDSDGFLVNPFGRKRIFFGRRSDSMIRDAVAFLPQSSNADLLNTALRKLYRQMDDFTMSVQVHDEVVGEIPFDRDWKSRCRRIKELMEMPVTIEGADGVTRELTVPADVEVSSSSWAETEEVEL